MKKLILIALLPVLLLSGCAVSGATHSDTHAAKAHTPAVAVQKDPLLKGFGDVITYKDGLSVSVSKPVDFTPSPEAAGAASGQTAMVFTVVLTNHTKGSVDIGGFPTATSGGTTSASIADIGANISNTPNTTLLQGQTLSWQEGFSIADPTNITFQYAPGFDYANAIFDSKH